MNPSQSPEPISPAELDSLARQLRSAISGEVRFDKGSRALYATDASLYREVPLGVVVPRSVADVKATLALCHSAKLPVLARGAGTSLAGQSCNFAVILDFSKYLDKLLDLNPITKLARVQPGCVLDVLRNAAERHHLTFGPDPSTHSHNTLGGMLGNNSCGVHSIMAGRTADNVRSLRILTYDGIEMTVGPTSEEELHRIIAEGGRRGEIYAGLKQIRDQYAARIRDRYPKIPRRVSGYNLDELLPEKGFNLARALVGSEGTCVTILEAELELIDSPPVRCLLVLGYEDVYDAGDHVAEILRFNPTGLEGMDHKLLQEMHLKDMHPEARGLLPDGGSWLFVEFGGQTMDEARQQALALMDHIRAVGPKRKEKGDKPDGGLPSMVIFESLEQQQIIWSARKSGLPATTRSPDLGDTWPGWEDAAVQPEKVGEYLRAFRRLLHKHGYEAALYGHFGDGCIHCRINFDMRTQAGVSNWNAFMKEAAELVVAFGGSLSGEHGDGQVRAQLLPIMYGDELVDVFRQFKTLWDPLGKMNPGKVIDPYPQTANIRENPGGHMPMLATEFAWPRDNYSFARAADRCVGVGECRRDSDGVMCPSYRATREEKHSTRGRARLLFEMVKGDPLERGWRDESVKEALDLCLACKGCKRDCPVNVDMATLKAEFMSHYFKGRLRPRAAYSMGLIWWWSRIASHIPRLTNFVLQAPGISYLAKKMGGIATPRAMPKFATETFTQWFSKRAAINQGLPQVLLWPDTFNNYFFPDTLKAGVRVLEAAAYQVVIPSKPLCCGRPLYAEGMLDQARRQLSGILDSLTGACDKRLPVVGLEPSCVASFHDELPGLFPADERAHYLAAHTHLLSDFLRKDGYQPPRMAGRALVHIHCHQHAVLDAKADQEMLERMGLEVELLDAGCCGLAGSFGFDAEKYELSQAIGELQLLPKVRATPETTFIVTNGFSCKEQIGQEAGRKTLNMAEILAMALDEGTPTLSILASTGRNDITQPQRR